ELAPVADHARIAQQPFHVSRAEARDDVGFEVREGVPDPVALAQDQRPREPALQALEAELLVEPALVEHGPPPLGVVLVAVTVVTVAPAAAPLAIGTADDVTSHFLGPRTRRRRSLPVGSPRPAPTLPRALPR